MVFGLVNIILVTITPYCVIQFGTTLGNESHWVVFFIKKGLAPTLAKTEDQKRVA